MNTLELKGRLIEMIADLNNQEVLQHLYEMLSHIIKKDIALPSKQEVTSNQSFFQTMIEVELPTKTADYQDLATDVSYLLNTIKPYPVYTPLNTFGASDSLRACLKLIL